MATETDDLRYGHVVDGRYRVGHEIGRGAMGVVYEATHTRLDRRVALKVLLHELASDADACERFEREARAASRIGSEHIVDVHDAGELPDGRRYLVLEHLTGETLRERYDRLAPLDPDALLPLLEQLLDGLAAAHDAGIVHRDIKPDNVFLVGSRDAREPRVKILDFGISKFRDVGANAQKSRTGVVLGTPHYMAPEQARGQRDVDRRADLYSVGVLAYEGLAGRRPFSGDNVNQLLFSIALEDVPPLTERVSGIDASVSAIVARATRRAPEQRYQSARELADDIRAWLDGDPLSEHTRALAEAPPPASPGPAMVISDEPTVEASTATFVGASPVIVEESEVPRPSSWRWLALTVPIAVVAAIVLLRPPAPLPLAGAATSITPLGKAAQRPPPPQPPLPQMTAIDVPSPSARPLPRPLAPPGPSAKTPRPIRKEL